MDSDRYLAVYEALSDDLAIMAFNLTRTSKNVRDRTAQLGRAVGRNAINFIVRGLIAQGIGLEAGIKPRAMAAATADNIIRLCTNLQLELTAEQEQEIWDWVASGDSNTRAHDL